MTLEPVTSTQISHVGYDPDSKTLYVRFHSGDEPYRYLDVPEQVHFDFMLEGKREGGSMGRFLHEKVKGNYEYRKPGEE